MKLYKQYLKERCQQELYCVPHGFLTYEMVDAHTLYIADIYIEPEYRRTGLATVMADTIVKQTGAKLVLGTIDPNVPSAHDSLLVLLAYGMVLDGYDHNLLRLKKDVK